MRSELSPDLALLEEAAAARAEKGAAIAAQDFERAANLRDRERELTAEARATAHSYEQLVVKVLAQLRKRD